MEGITFGLFAFAITLIVLLLIAFLAEFSA